MSLTIVLLGIAYVVGGGFWLLGALGAFKDE
jgi:hypothetical protein